MKALRRFLIRLGASITRRSDESRLREEVEEHLAAQTAENIKAGLQPDEARRQAVLKFGAVEAVKEDYRDVLGVQLVVGLSWDIRLGMRALRDTPVVTTVAILSLALGIGARDWPSRRLLRCHAPSVGLPRLSESQRDA